MGKGVVKCTFGDRKAFADVVAHLVADLPIFTKDKSTRVYQFAIVTTSRDPRSIPVNTEIRWSMEDNN